HRREQLLLPVGVGPVVVEHSDGLGGWVGCEPNWETARANHARDALLHNLDGRTRWRRSGLLDVLHHVLTSCVHAPVKKRTYVLARSRFALGSVTEEHGPLPEGGLLPARLLGIGIVARLGEN